MALDGPFRNGAITPDGETLAPDQETGFLEGSRALYTLERLATSLESFFHPSNSGPWALNVKRLFFISSDLTRLSTALRFFGSSHRSILQALEPGTPIHLQDSNGNLKFFTVLMRTKHLC
jgi:hypothetical protein